MRVADWMSEPVHAVGVGTPLSDCAERMRTHGIRHLPVVDGDGRLGALLSDFAFEMRGLFMSGRWIPFDDQDTWLIAEQVGHVPELVAHADDPLVPTLRKFHDAYQDAVIVVDADDRPIGILTEHDVVNHARELLPDVDAASIARTELPLLPDDTAAPDARSWMARKRLRHVLMVDDGVLRGVLSYRDVALEDAIQHVVLEDIAKRPVARHRSISARDAASLMFEHKIGCLPLVDDRGAPEALVTRREILVAVIMALSDAS